MKKKAPDSIRFKGRVYVQARYDEKTEAFRKEVAPVREQFEQHLTQAHSSLQKIQGLLEKFGYEKSGDKEKFSEFVETLDKLYYDVQYGGENTGWMTLHDRLYPIDKHIPQPDGSE